MDSDGRNEKQLTTSGGSFPAWSPDGQRIGFVSSRDGRSEIYVMDSDGANKERLTNIPGVVGFPSWSPDGERMSFIREEGGRGKIFVMDADGKNIESLQIDLPGWIYHRAPWSPDGKKIAFSSDPGNSNYSIWVVDADGANAEMVANVSKYDVQIAWSPDGGSIAFESNTAVNPQKNLVRIHVMDADGQNERVLAEGRAPCWSSDGKSIAFSWNSEIYTIDADGKNLKRLTNTALAEWVPDWWGTSAAVDPAGKLKSAWGKIKGKLFPAKESTLNVSSI
jgi:Tol biopolymer transport system component